MLFDLTASQVFPSNDRSGLSQIVGRTPLFASSPSTQVFFPITVRCGDSYRFVIDKLFGPPATIGFSVVPGVGFSTYGAGAPPGCSILQRTG